MGGQRRWLGLSRRQRAFMVPFGGALVAGVMLGLVLASGFAFDSNAYKILRDVMVLVGSGLLTWFGWRRVKAADEQNRNQTRALDRQTDQIALTRDQMELTRRDQLSKRFTEAVKQLGDKDHLEIRMGGIAGLWAVATESTHPEDRIMVLDVLCAFVRHASHPKEEEPQKIKPDVEFAMNRLGSVGPYFPWGDVAGGNQPYRRDFSGAYFERARFDGMNYNFSVMVGAKLSECSFINSMMDKCLFVKFDKGDMKKIIFFSIENTDISGSLFKTNCMSVVLFNVNVSGSSFAIRGPGGLVCDESFYYSGNPPQGLDKFRLKSLEERVPEPPTP